MSEVVQNAVKKSHTLILSCSCAHKYQDECYGVGKRLFNHMGDNSSKKYRCTVCGAVKEI